MTDSSDDSKSIVTSPVAPALAVRIHSMDQFRGFIVAMMFVVDYHLFEADRVFSHNKVHATFADMIMPGFIFAVGYSFRLTALRKSAESGFWGVALSTLKRSLLLILIVLVMAGFGFRSWKSWKDLDQLPRRYAATGAKTDESKTADAEREGNADEPSESRPADETLLPRHFWMHWAYWVLGVFRRKLCDVLGIIAVTQLFVLPFILAGPRIRILVMAVFGLNHVVFTDAFNWNFIQGQPNGVDAFLNLTPMNNYDGGFFGNLTWSVVMLAGSLTYDITVAAPNSMRGARKLFAWGAVLMCAGYLLTTPSRLYDLDELPEVEKKEQSTKLSASPVVPDFDRAAGRTIRNWLPPVPVLQTDKDREHAPNYWTAAKWVVSLPFVVFAAGFSFALYGFFVMLSDRFGIRVGVFRTFGTNALAAYVLHEYVYESMRGFVPAGAPDWYRYVGFAAYFLVIYVLVRALEAKKVYIRL